VHYFVKLCELEPLWQENISHEGSNSQSFTKGIFKQNS